MDEIAATTNIDESLSLTIAECETVLSCESSQNSSVVNQSHHSPLVNELVKMVMNLKAKAVLLEDQQESLLSTLLNIRDELDEEPSPLTGLGDGAINIIDNLIAVMQDVNLKVTTKRSNHEEEALHQVNNIINELVSQAQNEIHSTKELCHVYIRHCYGSGPRTDECAMDNDEDSFQSFILKCAPDDKHRIRRRLHGLLNYIDSRLGDIYSPSDQVTEK